MLGEAIAQCCGVDVQLKWPNDLYFGERKLGGVLIELLGDSRGATGGGDWDGVECRDASAGGVGVFDRPWTDLSAASGESVDRNELAAAV